MLHCALDVLLVHDAPVPCEQVGGDHDETLRRKSPRHALDLFVQTICFVDYYDRRPRTLPLRSGEVRDHIGTVSAFERHILISNLQENLYTILDEAYNFIALSE